MWENVIEVSDHEAMTQLRKTLKSGDARPSALQAAVGTEPAHVRKRLEQLLVGAS